MDENGSNTSKYVQQEYPDKDPRGWSPASRGRERPRGNVWAVKARELPSIVIGESSVATAHFVPSLFILMV
jgi:hypothetical protein